jgi:hypothetical protein
MKLHHKIAGLFLTLGLGACGGGGGATAQTAAVAKFPLQAGFKALVARGSTNNFALSGMCNGTATLSAATPAAATFEGANVYSVDATAALNLTDCTPATNPVISTTYYDSNFTPLGSAIPGGEYAKLLTASPVLPATVKVGDTAVYATLNTYTDSTKSTATGERSLSYVIEADTDTTVIANMITKGFDSSNQLLFTQQARYKIDADGTVNIVSIDVQYSTTSTGHLVYTKI